MSANSPPTSEALVLSPPSTCSGWESQLLETGFLAIFLSPLFSLRRLPQNSPTPWVVVWGYRWLLFRLILGSVSVTKPLNSPSYNLHKPTTCSLCPGADKDTTGSLLERPYLHELPLPGFDHTSPLLSRLSLSFHSLLYYFCSTRCNKISSFMSLSPFAPFLLCLTVSLRPSRCPTPSATTSTSPLRVCTRWRH